jgi:hypothetical protein
LRSSIGWISPPTWSSSSFKLNSFGGIPYATLPGHSLAAIGRKLACALRHEEDGVDSAGFACIDYLAIKLRIPPWQLLACSLFNYDHTKKMHRFELCIQGSPGRGVLWPINSDDVPRTRGTLVHIRAVSKHTIELGY